MYPFHSSVHHFIAILEGNRHKVVRCNLSVIVYLINLFFRSLYRELMFLSVTACGVDNIDVGRYCVDWLHIRSYLY